MNNSKNVVQDHEAKLYQLNEQSKVQLLDALKVDFTDIFKKYPTLERVVAIGYTPSWNDGEECYFSSEVYVSNMEEAADRVFGWDRVYDVVENNNNDKEVEVFLNSNENVKNSTATEVERLVDSYMGSFTSIFGSEGWSLVISKEQNGDAVIRYGKYDCGY